MTEKGFMGFLFGDSKARQEKKPDAPPPQVPPAAPPVPAATPVAPPQRPTSFVSKTPEVKDPEEALRNLAAIRAVLANDFKTVTPMPPPTAKPAAAAEPMDEKTKERVKDRKLYEVLLSGLYDGVLIFDAKGTVIGSNKRAEQFFGYDAMELWNMPCDQLIPALGLRVLTKIKSYAESGRFTLVNATCTRKDKSTFPAEIAISRINLLNEGDLILSIRNLERKEKARQRHEMELEALRWSGAGIIVCNAEGMIEYANPAAMRILRIQEEKDILKRFIGDFCTSHESASALIRTPSADAAWLGKLELRTPDDLMREVLAVSSLTPMQHDGKRPDIVITLTPIPVSIR